MPKLTPDELRLWHAWKKASDTVRARIGEQITAATGLSDPDFAILTRLEDLGSGTLRQSELAESMGWHRSRLSHQLTRMETRGLVTREGGGPLVHVSITDAGHDVIAAARPVHADAVRRVLAGHIPRAERERFVEVLEALAR
ncbi:MarR family winged helix-turn-helix transcriptional regulator [Gryllotalpicola reticulitermitis]|uniref:MarR family winged helix-turn-helix transcriptional regulator n=1 Tax=Gryllotalpicola reticulitermitis TaxID=1184153 RepID=A0ABV8QA33_9MICO